MVISHELKFLLQLEHDNRLLSRGGGGWVAKWESSQGLPHSSPARLSLIYAPPSLMNAAH
jgi:hypothetical protein